jgi:hypothetical protein
MSEDFWGSFKEWLPAVPGRWYTMLQNVILPFLAFIGLLIYAIEQSTKGLPIPVWDWVLMIVSAVAFVVLSFLAFHRMRLERDKKEQSDKIREERIKFRQQYSNRIIIPELLYKMSERVKELMKNTTIIIADDNESMADNLREIMQLNGKKKIELDTADMMNTTKLLAKFPSVRGYKSPTHQVRALVMSVYQVLTANGEGAKFLVEKDEEYQKLDKEVEELLIGLPPSINIQKDGYAQLVNAYYTLAALDLSKGELPKLFGLYQPFMKDVIVTELSTMRADISLSIEKFLIGEDIK